MQQYNENYREKARLQISSKFFLLLQLRVHFSHEISLMHQGPISSKEIMRMKEKLN